MTVAWLQSDVELTTVPRAFTLPVLELKVPTLTIVGNPVTEGPVGVVGGQFPELPAKVVSEMLHESVLVLDVSVLVTFTSTLNVLEEPAARLQVFVAVKLGLGHVTVAESVTCAAV